MREADSSLCHPSPFTLFFRLCTLNPTREPQDFTALDLVRSLMREADSSRTAEEIAEINL